MNSQERPQAQSGEQVTLEKDRMHVNSELIKFRPMLSLSLQIPEDSKNCLLPVSEITAGCLLKSGEKRPQLSVALRMRSGVVQVPMHSHDY